MSSTRRGFCPVSQIELHKSQCWTFRLSRPVLGSVRSDPYFPFQLVLLLRHETSFYYTVLYLFFAKIRYASITLILMHAYQVLFGSKWFSTHKSFLENNKNTKNQWIGLSEHPLNRNAGFSHGFHHKTGQKTQPPQFSRISAAKLLKALGLTGAAPRRSKPKA